MFPIILISGDASGKAQVGPGGIFGTTHVNPLESSVLFLLGMSFIAFLMRRTWLSWHNERITVQSGVVTWTNYKGRVRVQSPLADVLPHGLIINNAPSGNTYYTVKTKHGDINWNDSIDNCGDLVRIFQEAAFEKPVLQNPPDIVPPSARPQQNPPATPQDPYADQRAAFEASARPDVAAPHDSAGIHIIAGPGSQGPFIRTAALGAPKTYSYHTWQLAFVGCFAIVWGVVFFGGGVSMATKWSSQAQSSHPWPELAIFFVMGLAVALAGIYALGRFSHCKIIFDGENAVVYDWTGAISGHYSFHNLNLNDLTKNQINNRQPGTIMVGSSYSYNYSAASSTGTMRWTSSITDGEELYQSLHALAERQ